MIPLPGLQARTVGRACVLTLALLSGQAMAEDAACTDVAALLGKLADRMPKMTENARASRMGVVSLGTSASLAAKAAEGAGWTEQEIAPMAAMRDAREPDGSGQTLDMAAANRLFASQGRALAEVARLRCTDTALPDLSALDTGGMQ
ncbi:hypothetical protein ACW9UR_20420 [Halovulum sp. GXIMD14794]